MSFEALPQRLAQVRAEVARLGSQPVTIVAVTKGFGSDAIRAALAAGLSDIGENRVQEAVQKQDALASERGAGAAEERLHAGRGRGAGAAHQHPRESETRRTDDAGSVYG